MDYSSLYIKEKPVVAIIGGGNVATHLANALSEKADVTLVNPRTLENLPSHSDFDCHSRSGTTTEGARCHIGTHIRLNTYVSAF